MQADWVFVGLGNPGPQYAMTRHNIGFLVIQAMAEALGWQMKYESRFSAETAKGKVGQVTVHLLMPLTYMNESGLAVRRYLDYYKLAPGTVLVVADDVAIPFGERRVKPQGGAGGHNGLKSVEQALGTQYYRRFRMGIGGKPTAEHVLDRFTPDEIERLAPWIARTVEVMKQLTKEEFSEVMKQENSKKSIQNNQALKEGQES